MANHLTLDELKNMHDNPVFVVLEGEYITPVRNWAIVDCEYECVKGLKFQLLFEDYGAWLAYSCIV